VLGIIFYTSTRGLNKNVTPAEIEYLMFGDEYARKSILKKSDSGNIA
jgi:hypothetical protein